MSIYSAIRDAVSRNFENRALVRTRRIIDALPPQVQKDIGYPAANERLRMRQRTGLPL